MAYRLTRVIFLLAFMVAQNPPLYSFPKGLEKEFQLVKARIGQGKYSNVSLVRHLKSGILFALKERTGARPKAGDAYMKHANLHMLWKSFGLTNAELIYADTGKISDSFILHEYVEGITLNELSDRTNFLKDASNVHFVALVKFVEKLLLSHIYFLDLNAKNIIFNNKTGAWEIIDSQRGKLFTDVKDGFESYRKTFTTRKWTQGSNHLPRELVAAFFDLFKKRNLDALIAQKSKPSSKTKKLLEEVRDLSPSYKLHPYVKSWLVKENPFPMQPNPPQDAPVDVNQAANYRARMTEGLEVIPNHGENYLSHNGRIIDSILDQQTKYEGWSLSEFKSWIVDLDRLTQHRKITKRDLRRLLLKVFSLAYQARIKASDLGEVIRSSDMLINLLINRRTMFSTSKRYNGDGGRMYRNIYNYMSNDIDCGSSFDEDPIDPTSPPKPT